MTRKAARAHRTVSAMVASTTRTVENRKTPKQRTQMSISAREKMFMTEYLKDYDVRAAMIRVGYKDPDSYQCRKIVERLQGWLAKAQEQKAKRIGDQSFTSQERILEALALQAHYDPIDFVVVEQRKGEDGKVLPFRRPKQLEELTPEQRQCIRGVQFNGDGTVSYQLAEKRGAQVLIGRHMGMFNDKLIMEHRHRLMKKRADLTPVPDDVLEATEQALLKHMGPSAARMIGEYPDGGEDEE